MATKKKTAKKKAAVKKIKKTVKKVVKNAKKTVKKLVKHAVPKKVVVAAAKKEKPLGVVVHYYGHIGVAIIKCSTPVKVGVKAHFKGATTDFACTIDSMQYEHAPIAEAAKGQEVGIKVTDKVRDGDEVFLAN